MRAWTLFLGSMAAALLALLTIIFVSIALRLDQGGLDGAQTDVLLGLLYRAIYPLVFLSLGALTWHFVRAERGDYA